MSDIKSCQGMVLSAMPVGDYDKRLVLLTKERGRITAFARGARRTNSPYLASANPFVFGKFELYEGRNAYTLGKAEVTEYFRELAEDLDKAWYGFYFLEVAEYYSREGIDETERLKLLYQGLRAIASGRFTLDFLRHVYDYKTFVVNGEYPDVFSCRCCGKKEELHAFGMRLQGTVCDACLPAREPDARPISQSTLYALQFITATPSAKLFTFKLDEETEKEFGDFVEEYRRRYFHHSFKSEEFLKML